MVVACVAAAVTALVTYRYAESVCIATDASGQRVVIKTELTESGLRYRRENPNDDNAQILEALATRAGFGVDGPKHQTMPVDPCAGRWAVDSSVWSVRSRCIGIFGRDSGERQPARTKARAFISYRHEDADAVSKLKDVLVPTIST